MGRHELFKRRGIAIDLISGSVTDSQMGEDYIEREFGVAAGNARRNGERLISVVQEKLKQRLEADVSFTCFAG